MLKFEKMKILLLACCFFVARHGFTQSLDYISVRKQNGQVVKNFYAGTNILLQHVDGSYLQGPIEAVRSDSVYITMYDIRYYPTTWGSFVRDTISTTVAGLPVNEIRRVHLTRRRSFFQRNAGPLLMIGGGGYFLLNVLNGAFYDMPITDRSNVRKIGTAAGAFGVGYLLNRLFASDGFSKKKHRIVYVDL